MTVPVDPGGSMIVLALLNQASAQDLPEPPEDELLRELWEASRIPPQVRFVDGVARTVAVEVPVDGWDPESRARDFLTRFAPLYGLVDPRTELVLDRQTTDGDLVHLRFLQRHQGYRVDGGELTVHLLGDEIRFTNGTLRGGLVPVGVPTLHPAEVEQIAIESSGLGSATVLGVPSQVVYRVDGKGGRETRLAWEFQLAGTHEAGFTQLELAIDAVDGAILDQQARVAEAFDLSVVTASNLSRLGCWYFGGSTTAWFTEDGALSAYDPMLDTYADAVYAYGYARVVYDWFETEVGRTSYDDNDAQVRVTTHLAEEGAFYFPGCGDIGSSDGFARLDVLTHEFGHAVDHQTAGLVHQLQPGALSESFADVFAVLVDSNDPWIGEDVQGLVGSCTAISAIRNLSDPTLCHQPDHMDQFEPVPAGELPNDDNDYGSVHQNTGIPNKAAWLLIDGGSHRGLTVGAIGRSKVADLYHTVLTTALTSQSDFEDARDALVAQADVFVQQGSHGFTATDVCAVKTAFASVGIAPNRADEDCNGVDDWLEDDDDRDSIQNQDDNCVDAANWNQLDTDGDGAGDACDPDRDEDGAPNDSDNCPTVVNDQHDVDGDGIGDRCDDGGDGDGIVDVDDNCPIQLNSDQRNNDGDAMGDVCDPDDDDDGVLDGVDVCPLAVDRGQEDGDTDGVGDACDNCVSTWNADQEDCDGDGIGAVCDTTFDFLCHLEVPVAMHVWIHPLDLVALPMATSWTEGLRLRVRATAFDGTPLRIVDDQANHVAWIGVEGAVFAPAASARFEVDKEWGSFRTYYVEAAESVSEAEALEVEIAVEVEVAG